MQGNTFKEMINDLLNSWSYFREILQVGSTPRGKSMIDSCLELCQEKFPHYVEEIKGMAKGSEIDFEKVNHLFLVICFTKFWHSINISCAFKTKNCAVFASYLF